MTGVTYELKALCLATVRLSHKKRELQLPLGKKTWGWGEYGFKTFFEAFSLPFNENTYLNKAILCV